MTEAQRDVLLLLAEVYLGLGRWPRAVWLAGLAQAGDPASVRAARALLRAHLGRGDPGRALAQIDRLIEHEFDGEELAFALSAQSRALAALGEREAARRVWAEYVSLCRAAGLGVTEAMA